MLRMRLPPPPQPKADAGRTYTAAQRDAEAHRLEAAIKQPDRWGLEMCRMIAPLTLEINDLKREQDAIILAHSYQTPDIVYGVADEVGDSYGLSKKAMNAKQGTIVFSSVLFMAETAKILNPGKRVLIPEPTAGCSLADGITAADVRALKKQHPGVPVMGYVNTSAAVKAEIDVCCTSANYLEIARRLPGKELVFVPDQYMGAHLAKELAGQKTVHIWQGACEVHEQFSAASAKAWREQLATEGKKLVILAHPECDPKVLVEADFVGSTEKMMDYARKLEGNVEVMPITECGTADRMRAELPNLQIHGACVMCPYMKKSTLASILNVLRAPDRDHVIEIPEAVRVRAKKSLDEMFRLTEGK
ncbi:MAG: quinolinate synthase NadA [Candidatus Thermoplasmatota archaeon]